MFITLILDKENHVYKLLFRLFDNLLFHYSPFLDFDKIFIKYLPIFLKLLFYLDFNMQVQKHFFIFKILFTYLPHTPLKILLKFKSHYKILLDYSKI